LVALPRWASPHGLGCGFVEVNTTHYALPPTWRLREWRRTAGPAGGVRVLPEGAAGGAQSSRGVVCWVGGGCAYT